MTRNTKFGLISPLSLHPDAADDLRALMISDAASGGKIAAFLQQAKNDPKIIASLLDHDFGDKTLTMSANGLSFGIQATTFGA